MSFTATVQTSVQVGNDAPVTNSKTYTAASHTALSETAPASTADTQMNLAIDVSALKLLYIKSDVAITIETNSGSAADATLAVAAGVPVLWTNDGVAANPLGSTDVTSIFVTVAGGTAANVTIEVLQDPTP